MADDHLPHAPQPGSRDKYRDNDDVRAPVSADQRNDPDPDTRNEARGDARENVGNHARGTAAEPSPGSHAKHDRQPDAFDDDLDTDDRKSRE